MVSDLAQAIADSDRLLSAAVLSNPASHAEPPPEPLTGQADDRAVLETRGDRPSEREAVRVLVIGSRQGVMTIVQTLVHLGFADMADWSPWLPGPHPGEVMRILTRYLSSR